MCVSHSDFLLPPVRTQLCFKEVPPGAQWMPQWGEALLQQWAVPWGSDQGDAEALPLQEKSAKRGLIKMGNCEGRSTDITTSTVWLLFHHDAAFSTHTASQSLHSPPWWWLLGWGACGFFSSQAQGRSMPLRTQKQEVSGKTKCNWIAASGCNAVPLGLVPTLSCLVMSNSCDPMDCRPPGSSGHRLSQASILEWAAISFSRRSSQPRNQTHVSSSPTLAGGYFTTELPGKPHPLDTIALAQVWPRDLSQETDAPAVFLLSNNDIVLC